MIENQADRIKTVKTTTNSGDEMLKLDNQLCFALYVCSKEIIRKYKPILDPLGLTYTGYITLLALWEEDEITVKELGSRLYLDSGTLTPLLKKLEQQGYIERIRSTSDERNVLIKLTDDGRDLKNKAYQIPKDLICSTKLENFDAYDLLSDLHKFMAQIIDN
ncbi:MarR family transcriptional regulator [Anaerocolumna sedimenticola]|uniref:HTH-type transcriptional regulator SarZ n=1 Tax=Anaerocolumna sedimenticola TaxID=2696063 RepID=A0A6P1TQL6_9FIRM|nr:MarR family transcriptional regulator [Anaerocolumna sedimenticola]QHQ61718.1 MarR family transcriptional regulator [Anaerocolumna sedimenticola]